MAQQIVELHRERQEIVAGQRLLVAQTVERGREPVGAFTHRGQRQTLGARVDAADQLEDQHQFFTEGLRFARGQFHDGAQLAGFFRASAEELLEPSGFDVHDLLEHFVEARIRGIDDRRRIERRRGFGRFAIHR